MFSSGHLPLGPAAVGMPMPALVFQVTTNQVFLHGVSQDQPSSELTSCLIVLKNQMLAATLGLVK